MLKSLVDAKLPQPKFRLQGSFAYHTVNDCQGSPPKHIDQDDGLFLPIGFLSANGNARPGIASKAYFKLVEDALRPLCARNGWILNPGRAKDTCVRIQITPRNWTEELKFFLNRFSPNEPAQLTDFAASLTTSTKEELQRVLEAFNLRRRMRKVLVLIKKELDVARLQSSIRQEVEEKMTKQQREFFLRQQLKAIQQELAQRHIDAHVGAVGCIGMCAKEPLVDIQQGGKSHILYANVRPEMVGRIIEEHVVKGKPVRDWVICRIPAE
jgi:(2Fe-2S) ferredoxin